MLKFGPPKGRPLAIGIGCVVGVLLVAQPAAAQRSRHEKPSKQAGPPVDSSAVPRPETKIGCATFDVRVTASALVTAASSTGTACGPIEPVLAGTPRYDSTRGTVTLAIALVNRGPDRLHIPAALVAPPLSLKVTAGVAVAPPPPATPAPAAVVTATPALPPTPAAAPPAAPPPADSAPPASAPSPPPVPTAQTPGTVIIINAPPPSGSASAASSSPGAGSVAPGSPAVSSPSPVAGTSSIRPAVQTAPQPDALHFTNADFQPIDSMAVTPPNPRWTFDKLLQPPAHDAVTADDGSIVLPPGDTSAARPVTIAVPQGVTGFRVTLQGQGTYVFTIPLRAPDRVSTEEMEDSRSPDNLVTNDPRFPGRVVRDKLWLMFRSDATAEARQAAVDAVEGVVLGGMVRGQDRYYYLRIPANPDSGAAPLQRAMRTLAPMPQVQDVMPDRVQ